MPRMFLFLQEQDVNCFALAGWNGCALSRVTGDKCMSFYTCSQHVCFCRFWIALFTQDLSWSFTLHCIYVIKLFKMQSAVSLCFAESFWKLLGHSQQHISDVFNAMLGIRTSHVCLAGLRRKLSLPTDTHSCSTPASPLSHVVISLFQDMGILWQKPQTPTSLLDTHTHWHTQWVSVLPSRGWPRWKKVW